MKYLNKFNEAKKDIKTRKTERFLGDSGVLVAKKTFSFRYKYYGEEYVCELEEGEFIKYVVDGDYVCMRNGSDGYDVLISTIERLKDNFEKIDTSKPYKLEYSNGNIEYYDTDQKLHKDGGPAFIDEYGLEVWYQHGNLHREDGPALYTIVDGECISPEWYLNGKKLKERDFKNLFKNKDILSTEELKDILVDFIDDFDKMGTKWDKVNKKWTIHFTGKSTRVYSLLSDLESRLSDSGLDIYSTYDGESLKLTIT